MNVRAWINKRQDQETIKKTQNLPRNPIAKSNRSLLSEFFKQTERDHGRDARSNLAKELIDEVKGLATPHIAEQPDAEHTALRYEQYNQDPQFREMVKSKAPSNWHRKIIDTEAKAAYRKMLKRLSNISKHELSKAVSPKDWNRIGKAHNEDAGITVDHAEHMKQFPTPEKYKNMLQDQKEFKGMGRRSVNGISAKMIHAIPRSGVPGDEDKFMAKPYHKHIESATKAWVKKPILGWATMATKALFHAGGLGHLVEDVSAHEHNGVPLTVHKFANDYDDFTTSEAKGMAERANPLHVQQIATMDFLTNNTDRHYGNLMAGYKENEEGYTPLLAIDHERNFQYQQTMSESQKKRHRYNSEFKVTHDSPYQYISGPLHLAHKNFHGYHELQDWWKEHGNSIHEEFAKQVQHIKDPSTRQHVANNFQNRWEAMNEWAHGDTDTWDQKSLHNNFRRVGMLKTYEPRVTGKSIRDQLSKQPKEALATLVDVINKKDSLTYNQHAALESTMKEIVDKMSPHELSAFYLHAMSNPNYNTEKVRRNNSINPKQVILNHLSEAQSWHNNVPKYKNDHLRAMIDAIDSVPPQDKQQLQHWREHFARLLEIPQEGVA